MSIKITYLQCFSRNISALICAVIDTKEILSEKKTESYWAKRFLLLPYPILFPIKAPQMRVIHTQISEWSGIFGMKKQARSILRQSAYSSFTIGQLAIVEFFCGNINSNDIFCMNNLMIRMKQRISYSFYSLLYLYHCCILLERTKDIEKYHKQLLERPEYDPSNKTFVKDFIKLCKKAIT